MRNLPAGVPLIVQVAAGPAWITSAGMVVAPRAEQLGWSGTVTIRGASTVPNINFELVFPQAPQ